MSHSIAIASSLGAEKSVTRGALRRLIGAVDAVAREACFLAFVTVVLRGIFGVRIQSRGDVGTIPSGPFLIAANHQSHLDTIAVLAALPRSVRSRVRVAAAKDYFFGSWHFFWARWLFRLMPVERGGRNAFALRRIAQDVCDGSDGLLVFPEGTRSRTGEIGLFRAGVGELVRLCGVPVVPVLVENAFALLPYDRVLPRRGTVSVTIGESVVLCSVTREEIADEIRHAVLDLYSHAHTERIAA